MTPGNREFFFLTVVGHGFMEYASFPACGCMKCYVPTARGQALYKLLALFLWTTPYYRESIPIPPFLGIEPTLLHSPSPADRLDCRTNYASNKESTSIYTDINKLRSRRADFRLLEMATQRFVNSDFNSPLLSYYFLTFTTTQS